ncbi:MAG: RecX family transcriptional regulator [Deltaproteobacteria bacterium]|nr:RecX family transcriptional regulator [Deltaproteobacteria bacterium]
MEADPLYEKAQQSALRLLMYRGRSVAELRSRLKEKRFPDDITEKIIDRLKELKYLDDGIFARDWARSCAVNRLWGNRKIFFSLREKGVAIEVIEQSIEIARKEMSEQTAIARIMEKRFHKRDLSLITMEKEKNRLGQNLTARGFSPHLIFEALAKLEGFKVSSSER